MEIPEDEDERDSLVEIDELQLDKEWIRQPRLFRKYAFAVADAKLAVANRKADLDLAKADLGLKIREDPETFGVKKVTDASVGAAVIVQAEYRTALRRYNKAKHGLDMLMAVVEALEHRKKALENLVQLFSMNYFAEPKEKVNNERSDFKERVKQRTRRNHIRKKKDQ